MKMSIMNFQKIILFLIGSFFCFTCSTSDDSNTNNIPDLNESTLYFPPLNSEAWETETLANLGWNENALPSLLDFLDTSNTEAFMILKDGKIVIESYFNGATVDTNNPWFSAGKTLTAFMIGVAQQEGFLNINDASNMYLGNGWSELTTTQENAVTIRNHITMTTGLDYNASFTCTDPECLQYLDSPNSFWYYHNAPYTLTQAIISGAVGSDFNSYFNTKLRDRIGMQGTWIPVGFNKFYVSNARSMARFGLLCLNNGVWDTTPVLNDTTYFEDMTTTSQNLNLAYGYLWWLNGKSTYILPSSTNTVTGTLIPNAPSDLIAGLGANDQKLYVVPSENLIVIRMGDDDEEGQLGPSGYDNLLWEKISELIN